MTDSTDDVLRPALRLYHELADWWPLMSAPEDYEEEASIYAGLLADACDGAVGTLLELGSGGGNNALFMKSRFRQLTLTDLSPEMLDVSRRLNPECEHVAGDMRTLRLGRQFDAVFVHDAVCYMTTERDLRQAVETARVHCRPGGAVLFAPDFVRETFRPSVGDGGHDEPAEAGGAGAPRGLRYLEWTWDPDPDDSTYVTDYAYLLRERDGSVRAVHDRHVEGLFPRAVWQRVLDEGGFEIRTVALEHSEVEPGRHEMFIGRRRG